MESQRKPAASDTPSKKEEQAEVQQLDTSLSGAEALRASANHVLQGDSLAIAKALSDKAKEGHMLAARLLYLISIDELKSRTADLAKSVSQAAEWAAELEFQKEVSMTREQAALARGETP